MCGEFSVAPAVQCGDADRPLSRCAPCLMIMEKCLLGDSPESKDLEIH